MKIVNFILGLGTAIILGALINLGIAAFYPEPAYPQYPTPTAVSYPTQPCATTDIACQNQQTEAYKTDQANQQKYQEQTAEYQNEMKVYNRNLFIIANIVGIIVFVAGFFTVLYAGLAGQGVPIGIMIAGLWSIIYGYGRGWGSIDDKLKFVIGLVVAVIIIGGSAWLLQRRHKQGLA